MRTKIIIVLVISSLLLLFFYRYYCPNKPCIPINESLEIHLGFDYPIYVDLLNEACQGDTASMVKFLKVDYITGADGYSHGYLLCLVMAKVGDKFFFSALKKLNQEEVKIVNSYLSVGLDGMDDIHICSFAHKYVKTINYLKEFDELYVLYPCVR